MQTRFPSNQTNPSRTTALLLTLAALASSALPAAADGNAAPAATPITIGHCTVDEATAIQAPKIGFRTSFADGIVIAYTNERDTAATEVRFRIKYAGQTLVFVDRTNVAAHAKADREFSKFTAVYIGSKVDCSVLSATFADGTRWDAPDATPVPAASP
jgi:hypothetical protein